ncbi:MAG: histidinol-phosphate transaminase [Ruminococcus albus]|jgi:histidinol-phosphate aminotransferase|nr:histidinol-phosphate transaminase [Ruminococcus albus]
MSEKLWRKNLINIEPYVAGEQPKNDNIIKLNANENPYPPAAGVQEVLRKKDIFDLKKYPSADAVPLKAALAERYGLAPENVFCGNGSDDVLATAFRAFFNSDKPIFYPDITYSFYPVWCELLKIPYETKPVDGDFLINVKDFYPENGGVVIPNPNAPTAIGVGKDFIIDLLEHNRDVIVIIDEAYVDFGRYSCVELIKEYDNLIVTQTFSKSRSLAGMRIGMAFAQPELISYMQAVKDSYNSYPLDQLAIETGIASLNDEKYFRDTVEKIKATRDRSAKAFREMGFKVTDSETNFLFVSHPDIPAEEIFTYTREKGIFIRYFKKPVIDKWLRITIGTDEQMDKLIAAVKECIESR